MEIYDQANRVRRRSAAGITLISLGAVALGCGGAGPMVPVSGQVTFDGGPCPASGSITFSPNETFGDHPARPGTATFDTDGKFQVTSFKDGDGLFPGRYKVNITCLSGLPDLTQRDATASVTYIAPEYKPEEFVVEEESDPIEINYDVPQKK